MEWKLWFSGITLPQMGELGIRLPQVGRLPATRAGDPAGKEGPPGAAAERAQLCDLRSHGSAQNPRFIDAASRQDEIAGLSSPCASLPAQPACLNSRWWRHPDSQLASCGRRGNDQRRDGSRLRVQRLNHALFSPCSHLAAPSLYILTDQSIGRYARFVTTQEFT